MFENSCKIRVSARGIVFHDGNILLNRFGEGAYYNIPGGGIEKGETAHQAVVREIREETGLSVSAGELVFVLEYEPVASGYAYGDGHHISLFFRCELIGKPDLSVPEEPDANPDDPSLVSCPVWLPAGQLPEIELVPHIDENLLRYYQTGIFEPLYFQDTGKLHE